MYGSMPPLYYPPQLPSTASSTPRPEATKNRSMNEGGGVGV